MAWLWFGVAGMVGPARAMGGGQVGERAGQVGGLVSWLVGTFKQLENVFRARKILLSNERAPNSIG